MSRAEARAPVGAPNPSPPSSNPSEQAARCVWSLGTNTPSRRPEGEAQMWSPGAPQRSMVEGTGGAWRCGWSSPRRLGVRPARRQLPLQPDSPRISQRWTHLSSLPVPGSVPPRGAPCTHVYGLPSCHAQPLPTVLTNSPPGDTEVLCSATRAQTLEDRLVKRKET